MALVMEASRVTASTLGTVMTTTDLLAHTKDMSTMREKVIETSRKEYIACKFLLLANGGRYKSLRTHLEKGHVENKKPRPPTAESIKNLMAD